MDATATYSYHIITFGCQMNKNDSERMESILQSMNLAPVDIPEDAQIIIMNSCSVRASAEHRIYGFARKFAQWKQKNPELIIGVTGCMPGRDGDGRLQKGLEGVDLYFPTKDMIMLPKWLTELNPNLRQMEDLSEDYLRVIPQYQSRFQAFVTLQTGCNHFCTYCVVPFARGLEVNRPLHDILSEIRTLSHNGCVEVTLLGQIVNHWTATDPEHFSSDNPYRESDFAKLLWEINQIQGIRRIHWTAPHPLYMTDEVIHALTLPSQVNYLHLPVQSGNTEVLKRMNRRHDREFFLDVEEKIKQVKPDIALGTDIIVGFCGETDEQFQDTVSLYELCDFDISYTAQYSPRTGTVAHKLFADTVSREEKKMRWNTLQKMMEKIVLRKNQVYIGRTVSVLVDTVKAGMCGGNSREMKRVNFSGDASLYGTIVNVRILRVSEWILFGERV